MATATAALAAFERHLGYPQSRSRHIARQLQSAGFLALGSPGQAPAIDRDGFAALLIALAADNTIREATTNVATYFAMTPGGVSLEGAPASVGTARSALLALIQTAIDAPADLQHLKIEIVSNFPELALHWADGLVQRHQPTGTVPGHWQVDTHRRSTVITGRAFAAAVHATFRKD